MKKLSLLLAVLVATLMAMDVHAQGKNAAEEDVSIQELLADVYHYSSRKKISAIKGLGEVKEKEIIKRNDLINLLFGVLDNDKNARVKRAVPSAFYNMAINGVDLGKHWKTMIAYASDNKMPPMVRSAMIKLMPVLVDVKSFHYKKARSSLLSLLADTKDEPNVRAAVLDDLAAWGGRDNFIEVTQYMRDKDEVLVRRAIKSLAVIARNLEVERKDLKIILKALDEAKDPDVIRDIMGAMARMEFKGGLQKEIEPAVKKYIGSQDEEVALAAAVIAANSLMVNYIDDIGALLVAPKLKKETRAGLADVLGGLGNQLSQIKGKKHKKDLKLIYDTLVIAIQKVAAEDVDVATAIAFALGDAPACVDRTIIFKVLFGLSKVDGELGEIAVDSLQSVSGELYGAEPHKWQAWFTRSGNAKKLKADKLCNTKK